MFARTDRLMLRPGWIDDAPALATLLADGTVAHNLLQMPHPYSVSDAAASLVQDHAPLLPHLLVFKRTRGTPRLIGGCGLNRLEDNQVEIGYWIARPFWGLGFATEAAGALLGIARAFDHERIVARHFIDNPASGRVLRKLGFRPTGVIRPAYSVGRKATVPAVHHVLEDLAKRDQPEADAPADMVYRDAA